MAKPAPANELKESGEGQLSKAFLPIYRISRSALTFLDRQHSAGWTGHFEVLLPTLLARGGFQIADLQKIGRFYRGSRQEPATDLTQQSTLRYRPEISLDEFRSRYRPDTLYHPVKEIWAFDGKQVVIPIHPGESRFAVEIDRPKFPARSAGFFATWENEQLHVRSGLDPQGCMLNESAALVWSLCAGDIPEQQLIDEVQSHYPNQSVADDVRQALADLIARGLVSYLESPSTEPRFLVSLAFAGFGPAFPVADNYFLRVLAQRLDVIVAASWWNAPDVLIYRQPARDAFDHKDIERGHTLKI